MKKTGKLLSVIFAFIIVFSMFSVCSMSASADNSISFDIEARQGEYDNRIEISVYGYGMKGIDSLDLFLYTDKNQLEYDSCRVDVMNKMAIYDDILNKQNDFHIAILFGNKIETDGRIRLVTCYYYPLECGKVQIGVGTSENYLIAGQNVFEINTSDMAITYYSDEYRYEVKDNEAVIVDALDVVDETGIVTVPETIDGVPVVGISNRAFENTAYMIGVIIPESIQYVNMAAFKDCYSLEWIEVQGKHTAFSSQSFDYLRSHVAVFGADDADVAKSAVGAGLRYFSEKTQTGDINADGFINAADARLTLRISSKLERTCTRAEEYADMNKDGSITAADARIILRISAKLESIENYK